MCMLATVARLGDFLFFYFLFSWADKIVLAGLV